MIRTVRCCAFALAALAVACTTTTPDPGPQKPPGLYAEPMRLAFTCVTPGCDETQPVRINVIGSRRVAIKRILLAGEAQSDFSFTSDERPPFIVGANSSFSIDVTYKPSGAPVQGTAELRITFTDASAQESDDRLEPGELVVPLVRRLVGEPVLSLKPPTLVFGVVQPGAKKTVPLTVKNAGFGNVVLEITGIDAGPEALSMSLPPQASLAADASVEFPITWSPQSEGYMRSTMEVQVGTPGVEPGYVNVEGTSLSEPRVAIEPGETIDFGEVQKGKSRTVPFTLVNHGGAALAVSSVALNDPSGNLRLSYADGGVVPTDGGSLASIAPLGRVPMILKLDGVKAGDVASKVTFTSNQASGPVKDLTVLGTVTEPKISADPTDIDFGLIPSGWVLTRSVELRNVGYGTLNIKQITFVAGTSNLFTSINKPALPLALKRNARVAFDVQFQAQTQASFAGSLSVETDDPTAPFFEIPLKAEVGSCAAGCPITNGTPTCTTGTCQVGSCNTGWHDTDKKASNGCECAEIGTDPGQFCADSTYIGGLKDNDHVHRTFTGLLADDGDVDLIRFFAEDAFALFDENFKVRVSLSSSDPTINFCIYRNPSGSHQVDCFYNNEICPGNRYYEKGGSGGGADDADFIIKVTRNPGSAATCTPYTLFISNG
jgi:hypothetical protein